MTDPALDHHIITYSGGKFHPLSPREDEVRLTDIAHALSNICRWTGHVRWFYSVAEHCVRASHLVEDQDALAVLMHDASEAYCIDVPTPIKHSELMRPYRIVEALVQEVIGEHFNIDWKKHHAVIKAADAVMLASEARDLLRGVVLPDNITVMEERIIPWNPERAKTEFLRRYFELRATD